MSQSSNSAAPSGSDTAYDVANAMFPRSLSPVPGSSCTYRSATPGKTFTDLIPDSPLGTPSATINQPASTPLRTRTRATSHSSMSSIHLNLSESMGNMDFTDGDLSDMSGFMDESGKAAASPSTTSDPPFTQAMFERMAEMIEKKVEERVNAKLAELTPTPARRQRVDREVSVSMSLHVTFF